MRQSIVSRGMRADLSVRFLVHCGSPRPQGARDDKGDIFDTDFNNGKSKKDGIDEFEEYFDKKIYEAGEVKINHFEKVGNYAIRIYFSDGHKTGIYSWNTLIKIDQAKPNPGGLN